MDLCSVSLLLFCRPKVIPLFLFIYKSLIALFPVSWLSRTFTAKDYSFIFFTRASFLKNDKP